MAASTAVTLGTLLVDQGGGFRTEKLVRGQHRPSTAGGEEIQVLEAVEAEALKGMKGYMMKQTNAVRHISRLTMINSMKQAIVGVIRRRNREFYADVYSKNRMHVPLESTCRGFRTDNSGASRVSPPPPRSTSRSRLSPTSFRSRADPTG